MNSGKILYGLKIFFVFPENRPFCFRPDHGKRRQPEKQDGTGHKRNMACPFRDKIRKKNAFYPVLVF